MHVPANDGLSVKPGQSVTSCGPLLKPVPASVSVEFAEGWSVADFRLARGLEVGAGPSPDWHHDKAAGYAARLSEGIVSFSAAV